jgi:Fic family protein
MDTATFDPRKADAAYQPFPSFAEWSSRSSIDTTRWDRYTAELTQRRENSPALLSKALEVVKRAAAVDTGAIEGLYETDRGFTFTVAMQAAHWEAALEKKGPKVKALIESQLQAYDYILDFATQAVPIAEAWIRKLHAEICSSQDTYRVWTEIGWQEQPLPKGEYKHLPNHVVKADGTIHSHAPVDMTPTEMYRFCGELRSDAFLAEHPVVQAAYAHYAFVVIHPFADGNGRVARALASVFTYRSQSIPLLVLVDNRKEYYSSLSSADDGEFQPFADFTLERTLDAIQLASRSLRTAALPSVDEAVADLKRLYITRGGYSHAEVDEAGHKFLDLFQKEMKLQLESVQIKDLLNVYVGTISVPGPTAPTYRLPLSGVNGTQAGLTTAAPANANVNRRFALYVPKDCGRDDDIVVSDLDRQELFEARVTELLPVPTAALQMRIQIDVERIVRELLDELSQKAAQSLRT